MFVCVSVSCLSLFVSFGNHGNFYDDLTKGLKGTEWNEMDGEVRRRKEGARGRRMMEVASSFLPFIRRSRRRKGRDGFRAGRAIQVSDRI